MSESKMTVDRDGNKVWRNSEGQLYRTEGPAIEYPNGDKSWWVNGKLNRTDGPAIECVSGDKTWCINGRYHRINGPAIEWADGDKSWWVDGIHLDCNDEGFWKLWDILTDEQKKDPILLTYLPGDFRV